MVTVPPLVLVSGPVMTGVSLSLSVMLRVPVTVPCVPLGFPMVALTVGAVLVGSMSTVTARVVVPPWPSSTVMVKVSVWSAVVAPVAAAAWRMAVVGV